MREVRIAGVGLTPHGHFPHLSWLDLAKAAAEEARDNMAVDPKLFSRWSIYVGSAAAPMLSGEQYLAARLAQALKIPDVAAVDIISGEVSGALALRSAWLDVASGACDIALAVGVESWSTAPITAQAAALQSLSPANDHGESCVAREVSAGLIANECLRYHTDTRAALDAVVRKNRSNAVHNPLAYHRQAVDADTLKTAPNLADPLTTAHAADLVDGAAAVCLYAVRGTLAETQMPVRVLTIETAASVTVEQRVDLPGIATGLAARWGYSNTKCLPSDIDVAEVCDSYAIYELMSIEHLGLFPNAFEATLRGETGYEGRLPVNPSGGLLGLGHALGAGGLAQVVSVAQQAAGEAGAMQVPNVKRGLAHCLGGADTVAVVTLLERMDG